MEIVTTIRWEVMWLQVTVHQERHTLIQMVYVRIPQPVLAWLSVIVGYPRQVLPQRILTTMDIVTIIQRELLWRQATVRQRPRRHHRRRIIGIMAIV